MQSGHGHEVPPKFVQMKQDDDKLFTRVLCKERSKELAESSFRVLYYGGASSAVPFMWESQPGTPKHITTTTTTLSSSDTINSLPPLTPPPSYHFTSKLKGIMSMKKPPNSKSNFLRAIFPRIFSKKKHLSPSLLLLSSSSMPSSISSMSLSSSSSSSSCYSPSTPMNIPYVHGRRCSFLSTRQ